MSGRSGTNHPGHLPVVDEVRQLQRRLWVAAKRSPERRFHALMDRIWRWRAFRAIARQWRDAVNKHGGEVTLVELPALGIRGNTHFPMSDLNNVQIADLLSKFLSDKKLD